MARHDFDLYAWLHDDERASERPALPEAVAKLLAEPRQRPRDAADRRARQKLLRAVAAAWGGVCLSHSSKQMRWRCAEGHEWTAVAATILDGHWCQRCALARIRRVNLDRGFARAQEIARSRGGECLSPHCDDTTTPLRWRCALGHEWESLADRIRHRMWCPKCAHEARVSLTIDDMQATARERGGECLSKAYRGPRIPLRWRCAAGHEWEAPPGFVRYQGTWCPHCAHSPRKSLSEVRADARALGGELLSRRFLGAEIKHRYRCRLGHEFDQRPSRVASGQWCALCGQGAAHDDARLQEVAARRGGEVLSRSGRSRDRVRVRCREGHEWSTLQSNLMSGAWCRECAVKARVGQILPRLSITDMQATAAKLGGECLSTAYVNSYTKLRWRCREGHEWDARPNQVRSGSWCPLCARGTRGALNAIRQLALERGGVCLSERYQNHKERLRFRCAQGHLFVATGTVIKTGVWCPTCDPHDAPAALPLRARHQPQGV